MLRSLEDGVVYAHSTRFFFRIVVAPGHGAHEVREIAHVHAVFAGDVEAAGA